MATKLKNIKAIKIAALVMAVVMFLASGFFGSLFIRSFAHYAGDVSETYFETPSFRWQMNQFITDMFHSAQYLTVNSIEDYEKTTDGKDVNNRWQAEAERVSQAFDLLAKSEVRVHRDAQNRYRYSLAYNNVIYYFNYDGNFISAVINFAILALVVFWLVKGLNKLAEMGKKKEEEEAAAEEPVPEEPAPSAEEVLLTEIRDLLKNK